MTDFLIICILTSLKITAIHVLFNWEGMALYEVGNIIGYSVSKWIHKPFCSCLICMSSWWGIIFWFAGGGGFNSTIIQFILIIAGINILIDSIINRKRILHEE